MSYQGNYIDEYKPKFLSWCKSYEQEEKEMLELILNESEDLSLLKIEYEVLTGKRFRRRKNDD